MMIMKTMVIRRIAITTEWVESELESAPESGALFFVLQFGL